MFSDIVAYTMLMATDEATALRALEVSGQIHRDSIVRNGGRLLKELGDGVLAMFDSVSSAVVTAREIQSAAQAAGLFQLRIGIHLGEVTVSAGDVFGDGVNIAARIEAFAEPGTIVASETVYNNVRNKDGVNCLDLGIRELKGIAEPIRLYSIEV
jgi:class 3 adenylate cyclase